MFLSSTLPLVLMPFVGEAMCLSARQAEVTTDAFSPEVENALPWTISTTITSGCQGAPCMCRDVIPMPVQKRGTDGA